MKPGKTSLARKIQDQTYQLQPDEASTQGIDIIRWRFLLPQDWEFQVNIWDFGGQEIYHATHQFFLTKRSLYVLVVDNRKEHTDLFYWLNAVELLSDNSPLLIIQNEKDDRSVEINLRELRGRFDNLKETLPTNLKTNRGVDDILSHLKHYLSGLPHIGDKIPKPWLKVRQTLETNSHNYITLADYQAICRDNGLERSQDQLQLSGYLHDLGICLHFRDDILLRNTIILKPTWGTDAVYRVLDNEQVKKNLGRFSQNDLALIWSKDKYEAKQAELLQLMMRFKLCYELPDQPGWYIAPHLLTKNQPEYDWDEANNLLLRYEYKFMPKGIMARFIVAMHRYVENQRYMWESGVILSNADTRAEVIEYYYRREITIRVVGHYKRDFMTIIATELDKIHQSYLRLNYSKLVPCNCSSCKDSQDPYFYKYESLRRRLAAGVYEAQCDISYQQVNVRGLIDDIGEQIMGVSHRRFEDLDEEMNLTSRQDDESMDASKEKVDFRPKMVLKASEAVQITIRAAGHINLTPEIRQVLRALFGHATWIMVEAEFGAGMSGSRVFQVRPHYQGRTELATLVKIGPVDLIRKEQEAYRRWVANTLPETVRLEPTPRPPPDSSWDGLRYSLAGGGILDVESFAAYYQTVSAEQLRSTLEEVLFPILGTWWLDHQRQDSFQMQADYDFLLPVNLLIEPANVPTGVTENVLEAEHLPPIGLARGDAVILKGFVITEIEANQITLDVPARPGLPPSAYRIRLIEVANLDHYRVGQLIDEWSGLVIASRHDLLLAQASQAVGQEVDLAAEQLALPAAP